MPGLHRFSRYPWGTIPTWGPRGAPSADRVLARKDPPPFRNPWNFLPRRPFPGNSP